VARQAAAAAGRAGWLYGRKVVGARRKTTIAERPGRLKFIAHGRIGQHAAFLAVDELVVVYAINQAIVVTTSSIVPIGRSRLS